MSVSLVRILQETGDKRAVVQETGQLTSAMGTGRLTVFYFFNTFEILYSSKKRVGSGQGPRRARVWVLTNEARGPAWGRRWPLELARDSALWKQEDNGRPRDRKHRGCSPFLVNPSSS